MLGGMFTCCNLVSESLEFLSLEADIERLDDATEFPVGRRRVDSQSEWVEYDPDADDYDVTTAPLLPAKEASEAIVLKQIAALQGRILRGGDPCVLRHYQATIHDMRHALPLKAPLHAADLRQVSKYPGSEIGSEMSADTDSTCLKDDELLIEETQSNTSDLASRATRESLRDRLEWLRLAGDDESDLGAQGMQFGKVSF